MTNKEKSDLDKLIESQKDSQSWNDFVTRLPFLWYNQLTSAGQFQYRSNVLRTFPADSFGVVSGNAREFEFLGDGEDLPRGLVYSGHMVSFGALSKGIRTIVHPLAEASNMFLNRGKLANLLREAGNVNQGVFGLASMTKPSLVYGPPKFPFDIDGHRSYIIVDVESKDKRRTGKGSISDLWGSYKERVFVPLTKTIRNL